MPAPPLLPQLTLDGVVDHLVLPSGRPCFPLKAVGAKNRHLILAGHPAIGDKWSLLIVRDMLLLQKHRYGDFLGSDEGIPTILFTSEYF